MPKIFLPKRMRIEIFWVYASVVMTVGIFSCPNAILAQSPMTPKSPVTAESSIATTCPRPNIVFILADDLGVFDLSAGGSRFYESPNIDRIAHEGIRFTRGYASCQVCSPSRASIMLGKTPARHKITTYIGDPAGTAHLNAMTAESSALPDFMNTMYFHSDYLGDWKRNTKLVPPAYRQNLPAEDTTLAEALQEGGYRTFFAGKWHLGSKGSWPEDHGFELNEGGFDAGAPSSYFSPYRNPKLPDRKSGESLPQRLGEETAKFIRDHHVAHPNQPFLAYLSFYSVHAPLQTTQERWEKYRQKATTLESPEHRFMVDRTLPVRQVQDHPVYAGMIAAMDDAVGLVLQQLEDSGLTENTIVIFTSDNGGVSSGDAYATSNLPLRGGKGRQWEGGFREPWYMKVPGVTTPSTTSDTPVIHTDFYPTLLELAGLPQRPEQHCDGVSIVPLMTGGTIAKRDLFWHYPHYGNQGGEPSSIIMRDTMKLIHYWEDGRDELYDLNADPGEQKDIASQRPDEVKLLRERLNAWLIETQASLPVLNPTYDAAEAAKTQETNRTTRLEQLEKQHAAFLAPDFAPGPHWWGSIPETTD